MELRAACAERFDNEVAVLINALASTAGGGRTWLSQRTAAARADGGAGGGLGCPGAAVRCRRISVSGR
jgi:hypothetical protein